MSKPCLGDTKEILFADIVDALPVVEKFSASNSECDIYICALGFEDRTTIISENISDVGFKSKVIVIGSYTTNVEDNDKNYTALSNHLQTISKTIHQVNADSPRSVSNTISTEIEALGASEIKVAFDISVASSRFITSVLQTLAHYSAKIELNVFYAEPEDYFPQYSEYLNDNEACINTALNNSEGEALHESGVETVFNNELFPGHSADPSGNFVIIIPSYRMERIGRCLEAIDDQVLTSGNKSTFWIFGQPSKEDYSWRVVFQEQVAIKYMHNFVIDKEEIMPINADNKARCSTLDYREIISKLFDIIDSNIGKNITIIPNGSKLQMIGLSLLLACRGECQLKHAKPGRFNPNLYSRGIGDVWQIKIGSLEKIITLLQTVGSLKFMPTSID